MFSFLVKLKDYCKCKQLAEEFEDYHVLLEMCDELKDIEQIRTYIEQYEDKVSIFLKKETESIILFYTI